MTKEDYDLRKNTPEEIAGKIERVTLENASLPSEQRFLPETLLEFRTAINLLKRATVYTEHIVGLMSGRIPSEKWLLDHGGVVNEKCFRTREEYESYMEGINDSEGWYDHHLFKPEIR